MEHIKQTMWGEVLLKLPDFGEVIIASKSKDPKFKQQMKDLMKMAKELEQSGQLDKAMSQVRASMNRGRKT